MAPATTTPDDLARDGHGDRTGLIGVSQQVPFPRIRACRFSLTTSEAHAEYRHSYFIKETTVADLGTRYKCYKCGTKFYDLGKPQPLCPSCGEDQNNEETKRLLKRKRKRSLSKAKSDNRSLPDENGAPMDADEDVEEYVLDMEDIVLEEGSEVEHPE
jgi:hypothetical protein